MENGGTMEPRIQYARTSDGVSIAYWTLEKGEPLVFMLPLSLVRLEWQIPEWRNWAEFLAAKRQLIRYDGKGKCGTAAPRWLTRQRLHSFRRFTTFVRVPTLIQSENVVTKHVEQAVLARFMPFRGGYVAVMRKESTRMPRMPTRPQRHVLERRLRRPRH